MKIEYTQEEVNDILRDYTLDKYNIDLSGKRYDINAFGYRWSIEITDRFEEDKF